MNTTKRFQSVFEGRTAGRRAFTLVELLMVVTIIIILAGLTLVATNMAASSAKDTKTRATIQKLDVAMQQIFEIYEEKLAVIRKKAADDYSALTEIERQKMTTHFIRDLMRMEMPCSWAEVYDSADNVNTPKRRLEPLPFDVDGTGTNVVRVERPAVFDYYYKAYEKFKTDNPGKEPHRSALLFLVIQNLNPDALEAFHGNEVADTDGDGLLEFVDAWGKPIQFLRWAPAFSGSDLQPDVLALAGYVPKTNENANSTWWNTAGQSLTNAFQSAMVDYPDPFDEQNNFTGWFLYPLIYSAGADGKYDLMSEGDNPDSPTAGAAGILDPFEVPYGMPGDNSGTGTLNHHDNIHNHRWNNSF